MYAPVTPEDHTAAETLMCLLYGSESNARAEGAFTPVVKKEVMPVEAMEEAESAVHMEAVAPTKPAKSESAVHTEAVAPTKPAKSESAVHTEAVAPTKPAKSESAVHTEAVAPTKPAKSESAVHTEAVAPTKPAKAAVLAVTAVTAGPSGVLREHNRRQKIPKRRWSTSSEETEEDAVDEGVPIGSGKTIIPMEKFRKIKWRNYKAAVRSLLDAVFPKSVLATHSLSGKPSPAFSHLPAKKRLNPVVVEDIVEEVFKKFLKVIPIGSIKLVVTTKCADEAKIAKNLKKKKEKEIPIKKRECPVA